jgi:hypothetical protein
VLDRGRSAVPLRPPRAERHRIGILGHRRCDVAGQMVITATPESRCSTRRL